MIAVIGCGNPERSDEGAGIAVARLLHARGLASRTVRVFDSAVDGLSLLYAARGCTTLVLVDASTSGAQPGAISEARGEELEPKPGFALSELRWNHALHGARTLYGAQFPTDVTVLFIEPQSMAIGRELSDVVAAATVKVADRVAELVQARLTAS